jgi:hypothetical protein
MSKDLETKLRALVENAMRDYSTPLLDTLRQAAALGAAQAYEDCDQIVRLEPIEVGVFTTADVRYALSRLIRARAASTGKP